jgi:hypothetical protein
VREKSSNLVDMRAEKSAKRRRLPANGSTDSKNKPAAAR